MITLRYYGQTRTLTQCECEQTSALAAVKDALTYIKHTHGREAWKAARASLITRNGVSINLLSGFRTPLADGDVIAFLPVCGGG